MKGETEVRTRLADLALCDSMLRLRYLRLGRALGLRRRAILRFVSETFAALRLSV